MATIVRREIATQPSLAPGRRRSGAGVGHGRAGLAMTIPFVLFFIAFFVCPLVYSVVESFRSGLTGGYVGLKNYHYVLSLGTFWHSIVRMLYFGVVQVTIMLGLAGAIALFLDSRYSRGKAVFSLIFFIPYAVPGVIAAIMYGFLFSPSLDGLLHVPATLGLAHRSINPLSSNLVLYAIMLIVTWEFTGYNMVICMAGLSSIPREVLDAGRVDGCSEAALAWRIKLPIIRRTVFFVSLLSIIGTLQIFNEPEILNTLVPLAPGYTPNLAIYDTAFIYANIPVAAALAVVLALITMIAALIFFRFTRRSLGNG
jgi:multiple sugar transport system permease protein